MPVASWRENCFANWERAARALTTRLLSVVVLLLFACTDARFPGADTLHSGETTVPRRVDSATVAVIRSDGALIPFARFSAARWTAPPEVRGTRSDTTGDVAGHATPWFAQIAPAQWYAWLTSDSLTTITTSGTKEIAAHCDSTWALSTNVSQPPAELGTHHGNLGVASDAAGAVHPVVAIADTAAIAREATALLREAFARSESTFLAGKEEWLKHLLSEPARGEPAVTVTRVLTVSGAPLYHLIAEKKYGARRPDQPIDCPSTSRLTAWARPDAGGRLQIFGATHNADACDRKSMPDIRVLGAATIDGRDFVFIEEHYYEWEKYVILEVLPESSRRLLTVGAGGC